MANIYTFSMPYRGRTEAWVEAENEEEAKKLIDMGHWDDTEDQTWEPDTFQAVLVSVEPLTTEESE